MFEEVVEAAASDRRLSPAETRLAARIGATLGLEDAALFQRLEQARQTALSTPEETLADGEEIALQLSSDLEGLLSGFREARTRGRFARGLVEFMSSYLATLALGFWMFCGILAFGWDVVTLGLLFWSEIPIALFFVVLKVLACSQMKRDGLSLRTPAEAPAGPVAKVRIILLLTLPSAGIAILSFILWSWLAAGSLLPGPRGVFLERAHGPLGPIILSYVKPSTLVGFLLLIAQQGQSFLQDLAHREFRRLSILELLKGYYTRVGATLLAFIFGGFFVVYSGLRFLAGLVLVPAKTGLDLVFLARERRQAFERSLRSSLPY